MNRITRMLTITGFGLVAGATIGAGPAMAATGGTQSAGTTSATQATTNQADRVVGFYRNLPSCVFAGRLGERFDRWDDFTCRPVRFGMHRGAWALVAQWNGWGGDHDGDHNGGHHDGDHDGDHNGGHHDGDHDGDHNGGHHDGDHDGDHDGGHHDGDHDGGHHGHH